MIISIDYLYWLAGLVLAITALLTFADRTHPRRFTTGLFWLLYAAVFWSATSCRRRWSAPVPC